MIVGVLAVLVTLGPGVVPVGTASAAGGVAVETQADPEPPDPPPVTVSDFYPEDANLSDCIGLVEKPGCGSDARGGWRQFAVLTAVVLGMALIGWRISRGIRGNRADTPDSSEPPSAPRTPSPPTGRNPS